MKLAGFPFHPGNFTTQNTLMTTQLAASEAIIGKVVGVACVPSSSFTRPADTTAYASGDLVANNTSAGSVVPMSFPVVRAPLGTACIRRARLKKSGTSTTLASFRLHLYTLKPTCANGDNSAWSTSHSGYLGSIDLDASGTTGRAWTDGSGVQGSPAVGSELTVEAVDGRLVYGLMEARAGYTPVSGEVFTVELEVFQG